MFSKIDGLLPVKREDLLFQDKGYECSNLELKNNDVTNAKDKWQRQNKHHCKYCDYKTNDPNCLKRHLQILHTVHKSLKCPHCDYRSLKTNHIKIHIITCHTDEKPYECSQCDFKTIRLINLKRHIMSRHTGEKPYKCSHCDFKTIQYYTLKVHMMAQHTGVKPHSCTQCEYKTSHGYDLKRHIIIHHTGEKPFKCSHCDYECVRGNHLKTHIRVHHVEIPSEAEDKTVDPKEKLIKRKIAFSSSNTKGTRKSTIEDEKQNSKRGNKKVKRLRASDPQEKDLKPKHIINPTRLSLRSASKITSSLPEPEPKVAEHKRQFPKRGRSTEKITKTFERVEHKSTLHKGSAPNITANPGEPKIQKKGCKNGKNAKTSLLNGQVTTVLLGSNGRPSRYRVAIVPSDYPLTQLSSEQCEMLKDKVTDKLDEIDEERDDHPLFNGISYEMGACIVACDNEASMNWLSKVITNIIVADGITLRTCDPNELLDIIEVGSFFPGKAMTEEALLKRLRVQNAGIENISRWSVGLMKQVEKGFYATLRIPETSLRCLKAQGMEIGYGLDKLILQEDTDEYY